MTNYITQNGTVQWDRAEPFIWLLAEHENEVFKARIDQIEDRRRQPKTISISEDANLLMGESN
jgi:5'-3' exonuclease